MDIATQRLDSIKKSSKNAPLSFSGYTNRIKNKEKTLDKLLNKITSIISYQEKLIETEALSSLRQRYHQIQNYHTRASYSLARLYDRLTLPKTAEKIRTDKTPVPNAEPSTKK